MSYQTKSSGEFQDFGTGSRRDSDPSKPFIHRIPPIVRIRAFGGMDKIPVVVRLRLGGLYRRGAEKYADANEPVENWKKGQPLMTLLECAQRHLTSVDMGMEDEDHCAAVFWNLSSFMWTKHMICIGLLPEVVGQTNLVAAYNAVVDEYRGERVSSDTPSPLITGSFEPTLMKLTTILSDLHDEIQSIEIGEVDNDPEAEALRLMANFMWEIDLIRNGHLKTSKTKELTRDYNRLVIQYGGQQVLAGE